MFKNKKQPSDKKNAFELYIISPYYMLLNKGKLCFSNYKDFIILLVVCFLLVWNRIFTLEDWIWFFVGFAVLTPLTLYYYKKLL